MTWLFDGVADLTLAGLFGGMLFFPIIVAPRVFRVLDEDAAGRFLRDLFPGYYAYIVFTSGVAGVAMLPEGGLGPLLLFAVAGSTLVVRQALVPRINAWRDAQRAGDEAAGRRFALGHRLSVWINGAQMLVVAALLVTRGG
ncbi:MAG: DUF4149 domain-containing protein [Myxococcota bacterium]